LDQEQIPLTLARRAPDPCFDRLDAHPHRITGGDAEANLAGDGSLLFSNRRASSRTT
jgi:hypothetical protein